LLSIACFSLLFACLCFCFTPVDTVQFLFFA
jgi:hypothetical protein